MKRNVHVGLSFLAVVMVLATGILQAQSRLLADVPFAFVLGEKSMAAGNYEIESRSGEVALLRNLDNGVAQFLIKSPHAQSRRVEPAKLVFHKYGDQYFLSQIWDGSSNTGIQLVRSKREKEVSMARSGAAVRPEMVMVAMK